MPSCIVIIISVRCSSCSVLSSAFALRPSVESCLCGCIPIESLFASISGSGSPPSGPGLSTSQSISGLSASLASALPNGTSVGTVHRRLVPPSYVPTVQVFEGPCPQLFCALDIPLRHISSIRQPNPVFWSRTFACLGEDSSRSLRFCALFICSLLRHKRPPSHPAPTLLIFVRKVERFN